MEVYKYCDARGVAILENLELKVTPPNEFNDPFEFAPHVISTNPLRRTKRLLRSKDYLRATYNRHSFAGSFQGNFREFRAEMKKARKELAPKMAQDFPQSAINAGRDLLNAVSKVYGVLCLCMGRSSILMWGHYADKHEGVVIGFDSENKVLSKLNPVDYRRERVVFNAGLLESERDPSFPVQLLLRKNIDWKYEDEMRQLFYLNSLRQRMLNNGKTGYFLEIPPEAVTRVTLGARSSADLEMKVQLALKNPKLSHVKLDRAKLHDSKFEIGFQ